MHETEIGEASTRELCAFGRALLKAGAFDNPATALDVVEAPLGWAREFKLWSVLERPSENGPHWAQFCELIWKGEPAIREFLLERDLAAVQP